MQLDKKHFRLKLWSIRLAKLVAFGGSPQAEIRSERRFVLFFKFDDGHTGELMILKSQKTTRCFLLHQ